MEEINDEESRQMWRAVIAFNGGKDAEFKRAMPAWTYDPTTIRGRATTGIDKEVAVGLVMAMRDGLITGDLYINWPAANDGKPLIRAWESIANTAGVE